MIEKPEILSGNVKSFEDWLHWFEYEPQVIKFKTRSEYGLTKSERIRAEEEQCIIRRTVLMFYLQTFDPQLMVPAYFESFFGTINGASKPNTLAQFISDTLRCGIILVWK